VQVSKSFQLFARGRARFFAASGCCSPTPGDASLLKGVLLCCITAACEYRAVVETRPGNRLVHAMYGRLRLARPHLGFGAQEEDPSSKAG